MPRKINKRKATQAAKRKVAAEIEARKNRRWPGTRRPADEGTPRVGMIARHNGSAMTLAALLLGARAFARPTTGDSDEP